MRFPLVLALVLAVPTAWAGPTGAWLGDEPAECEASRGEWTWTDADPPTTGHGSFRETQESCTEHGDFASAHAEAANIDLASADVGERGRTGSASSEGDVAHEHHDETTDADERYRYADRADQEQTATGARVRVLDLVLAVDAQRCERAGSADDSTSEGNTTSEFGTRRDTSTFTASEESQRCEEGVFVGGAAEREVRARECASSSSTYDGTWRSAWDDGWTWSANGSGSSSSQRCERGLAFHEGHFAARVADGESSGESCVDENCESEASGWRYVEVASPAWDGPLRVDAPR